MTREAFTDQLNNFTNQHLAGTGLPTHEWDSHGDPRGRGDDEMESEWLKGKV